MVSRPSLRLRRVPLFTGTLRGRGISATWGRCRGRAPEGEGGSRSSVCHLLPCARPLPQHRLCAHALLGTLLPRDSVPSCPHLTAWDRSWGHLFRGGGQKWVLPQEEPERQDVAPTGGFARHPDIGVSSKAGRGHLVDKGRGGSKVIRTGPGSDAGGQVQSGASAVIEGGARGGGHGQQKLLELPAEEVTARRMAMGRIVNKWLCCRDRGA